MTFVENQNLNDMSVQIVSGKKGWHLKIDGCFICQGFGKEIVALKSKTGIPYGATEWTSISAIRCFWQAYRVLVVHATKNPCTTGISVKKFNALLG